MKKCAYLLAALLLVLAVCTSCGNGEAEQPIALVIIAGRHANAKMYTEDRLERARDLIEQCFYIEESSSGCTAKAQVAVIVSDGNPTKAEIRSESGEDILNCSDFNRQLLEDKLNQAVDGIIEFLRSDSLKADDPEVDLLSALNEARKELDNYPDAEPHILILDTGITTAGKLDMQWVKILEGECNDIVEQISDGIPNLNGAKVTFLNLGNVAGDQAGLGSVPAENRLKELWTAIIEKANGILEEEIKFSTQEGEPMLYYGDDDGTGYEFVKSIIFVEEEDKNFVPEVLSLRDPEEVPSGIPADEPIFEVTLKESQIGFKAQSAEFIHGEDAAIEVLNTLRGPLEEFLNFEKQYSIYIVGSIAKTAPDKSQRTDPLSHDRAEKVANLLIREFGIPEERIIIVDAGVTKFSWRNAEEFPGGEKDPDAQQANRVVTIFGENSTDLVQQLWDNDYIS